MLDMLDMDWVPMAMSWSLWLWASLWICLSGIRTTLFSESTQQDKQKKIVFHYVIFITASDQHFSAALSRGFAGNCENDILLYWITKINLKSQFSICLNLYIPTM